MTARHGSWVLAASILSSGIVFIDGTAVNVALPALQSSLHATVSQVEWVIEGYTLFLAALLLVGGSLGDLYGRRKIFVIGVLLFAAASAWCGLAPDIHHLIAARALQGVGGALLVPGSLALISASFPEAERGRAIGVWSGFSALTAAIGPVLGGWLIEHASWRWVFAINLPLAAAVVVIAQWKVPESRNQEIKNRSLDWLGALLASAGLGGIVFALIQPAQGVGPAVAGVIALAAFFLVEARAPAPMFPLGLLRSRDFLGANLVTLTLYTALSGLLFFLPLNLIQIQHYSATAAGAALLPFVVLLFFLSRWSGGLVARYGSKPPLVAGPLLASAGFALFALPGIGGSYWTTVFPAILTLGMGMTISVAPLTTTVMQSVPENRAGTASGINNAVSRVAGLFAVAILGFVMIQVFDRELDAHLKTMSLAPAIRQNIEQQRSRLAAIETSDTRAHRAVAESFLAGYRTVIWISVALSIASSVMAAFLLASVRVTRPAPSAELHRPYR